MHTGVSFSKVILEGPDNGGKSTLASRLVERSGGVYVSNLGGRTMTRDQLHERARAVVYSQQKLIIAERFHPISDYIYRKIFGGERVFTDSELKFFLNCLAVRGSLIVYCRPPLPAAMGAEHRPAGDDDAAWIKRVEQDMPTLFRAYDVLMAQIALHNPIKVVHYDWTCSWSAGIVEDAACAV